MEGNAHLENMHNHSGISVELKEIKVSLITDSKGRFTLPTELADGDWTLRASYPYFETVDQTFTVISGIPKNDLSPMTLEQKVVFDVAPDKLVYRYGETVFITLTALNVSDDEVTIYSLTSPMAAFAVRHDGETVVGGLFPGQGAEAQEITLEPGVEQIFEMSWTIDNFDLAPGEYEIYGLLTNSGQYPDYFTPFADAASELNASLYSKLTPATIKISLD
jgi:hypothetical protein